MINLLLWINDVYIIMKHRDKEKYDKTFTTY